MPETWLPIPARPGCEVSNRGRRTIIIHALETVLAGEHWISPTTTLIPAEKYSPSSLTQMKRSVLQRLANGQSVKQIAAQMERLERSVRDYISGAIAKMKVKSRARYRQCRTQGTYCITAAMTPIGRRTSSPGRRPT